MVNSGLGASNDVQNGNEDQKEAQTEFPALVLVSTAKKMKNPKPAEKSWTSQKSKLQTRGMSPGCREHAAAVSLGQRPQVARRSILGR